MSAATTARPRRTRAQIEADARTCAAVWRLAARDAEPGARARYLEYAERFEAQLPRITGTTPRPRP